MHAQFHPRGDERVRRCRNLLAAAAIADCITPHDSSASCATPGLAIPVGGLAYANNVLSGRVIGLPSEFMGLVKATHQQRTELTLDVTQRAKNSMQQKLWLDSIRGITLTTRGPN